jgi:LuxR family maltose regulon positive regulatory protein
MHARDLRRGRDALTISVLQAVVARRRGHPDASARLAEAMRLAELAGIARLLEDTHPLAVEMGAALAPERGDAPVAAPAPRPAAPADAPRSQLLTPKETLVLKQMSVGHANKVIARALAISDETVKWHVKNVLLKLSAGNRTAAVDRARLLGLLD